MKIDARQPKDPLETDGIVRHASNTLIINSQARRYPLCFAPPLGVIRKITHGMSSLSIGCADIHVSESVGSLDV